jgi:hypothetical protein
MDNEQLQEELNSLKTRIYMIETLLINTNGQINNQNIKNTYQPIKYEIKQKQEKNNENIKQHSITY